MYTLSRRYSMYVGTYTHGKSKGIYIFDFDAISGKLELKGVSSELENPSYLCVSKNSKYLYAVMEVGEFQGEAGGAVGAYSIDSRTGLLKLINIQPTKGKDPCHLSTDSTGKYLFAANYSEGTFSVYPIGRDGQIDTISFIIRHMGSGPNKARQEEPHVHYVALTPDEKYLCAVDLGIDKINIYSFTLKDGCPAIEENLPVTVKPGSGPRHMVFHPNSGFAYLLTELSSEVIAFEYNCHIGAFNQIQCITTLPAGLKGTNYCAAIHISPCGKFLYSSNRGHDSIALFRIIQASGRLEPVSHIPTRGSFPRDFAIDPTGRFLFAANQDSDTIIPFAIMPDSGLLEQTGDIMEIPDPVCIKVIGPASEK